MKAETLQLIEKYTEGYPDVLIDEQWKDWGNGRLRYKISSDGRVMNRRVPSMKWKYYKPQDDGNGYFKMRTFNTQHRLHRLVALLFIHTNDRTLTVNHKNGNKKDNRADNLEWCTLVENLSHARKLGLTNTRGSKNGKAKLTEQQVIEMRSMDLGKTNQRQIAKIYGISQGIVSEILSRKRWRHI